MAKVDYRALRDYMSTVLTESPDGTYDLESGEPVDFSGKKFYQVSFQTTQTDTEMSSQEFNKTVEMLKRETKSRVYLGKFDGNVELSFAAKNRKLAMEIAKRFNQHSIWDWKSGDLILNDYFNKDTNIILNY